MQFLFDVIAFARIQTVSENSIFQFLKFDSENCYIGYDYRNQTHRFSRGCPFRIGLTTWTAMRTHREIDFCLSKIFLLISYQKKFSLFKIKSNISNIITSDKTTETGNPFLCVKTKHAGIVNK